MKTDTQLKHDVIGELETELGNRVSGIGVSINDGAAMLSGTAATYTDKYAAERAALRMPGVRAVSEGIGVGECDGHSDDATAKAVASALQQDPSVPATVQATVEGGWVTLRGEVASTSERLAALNAVQNQAGTQRIYNLITVKPTQ